MVVPSANRPYGKAVSVSEIPYPGNERNRPYRLAEIVPNDRITLRVSGERGNEFTSRVAPYPLFDGA